MISEAFDVIKDMAADYLGEFLTFDGSDILAVLTLAVGSDERKFLAIEFLDTNDFKQRREREPLNFATWGDGSESDKVFIKLLPYSEYVALAKQGKSDI